MIVVKGFLPHLAQVAIQVLWARALIESQALMSMVGTMMSAILFPMSSFDLITTLPDWTIWNTESFAYPVLVQSETQ